MKVVGSILMCAILSLSVLSASSFFWERRIFKAAYPWIQQYPYTVFLESKHYSRGGDYHYCSGALVSRGKVLTSGLCMMKHKAADGVIKKPMTNAILGANRCDYPTYSVSIVKKPIFHPKFKTEFDASDNDLAIIELAEEVKFNHYVQSVKLVTDAKPVEIGEKLTALGYGWNDNTWTTAGAWGYLSQLDFYSNECALSDFPVKVTKANLPICYTVHVGKLDNEYNEITKKFYFNIKKEGHDGHIAIGDFGGPVVRTSDKTLVGITSGLHYNKTSNTIEAIHSAIHAKSNLEFIQKYMRPSFH